MTPRTGFITGTGFYTLPSATDVRPHDVDTPFGRVSVELTLLGGVEVAFIPRHGKDHTIAPREIDFRANLWAMRELGVARILATSVSGSLVPAWGPGTMVLVDQFLNFAHGRADSFYPRDGVLAHVDVTDPYCRTLHEQLAASASGTGIARSWSTTANWALNPSCVS